MAEEIITFYYLQNLGLIKLVETNIGQGITSHFSSFIKASNIRKMTRFCILGLLFILRKSLIIVSMVNISQSHLECSLHL